MNNQPKREQYFQQILRQFLIVTDKHIVSADVLHDINGIRNLLQQICIFHLIVVYLHCFLTDLPQNFPLNIVILAGERPI